MTQDCGQVLTDFSHTERMRRRGQPPRGLRIRSPPRKTHPTTIIHHGKFADKKERRCFCSTPPHKAQLQICSRILCLILRNCTCYPLLDWKVSA